MDIAIQSTANLRFSREKPASSTWEIQVQVLIYLVLGPLMNDVVNTAKDERIHYEDSNNENGPWEEIMFSTLHTYHETHVIIF